MAHQRRRSQLNYGFTLGVTLMLCLLLPAAWSVPRRDSAHVTAVRWRQDCPECSFRKAEDGTYQYSLTYETLQVTLTLDPAELARTRRTLEHVFEVVLTFRNRGTLPVTVSPAPLDLELVDHHRVRLPSIDPDNFSARIQNDSDELVHQSERELRKHPERRQVVEDRLREHEKLVAQWLEHLSTRALRDTTLNSGRPEISGLVMFNTKTRWRGDWKEQENFVLRVPAGNVIFEFPFTLPPAGDAPALRPRPEP
jgi:hypothetical protein